MLSELDKKMTAILRLIQEGDTKSEDRRSQLIQMVEELNKSYRSLAEKHEQLRSQSARFFYSRSSSSSALNWRKIHHVNIESNSNRVSGSSVDLQLESFNSHTEPVVEDPDVVIKEPLEKESMWFELRSEVAKLMEENLRQQAELIRRNDEKREAIKELNLQLDRLMAENKALWSLIKCSKDIMKHNNSPMSKLKDLLLGKFFRGGAP